MNLWFPNILHSTTKGHAEETTEQHSAYDVVEERKIDTQIPWYLSRPCLVQAPDYLYSPSIAARDDLSSRGTGDRAQQIGVFQTHTALLS